MLYVGRFAPTPSGPLHFGSLVTALASWLEARYHGGQWLVRIEDLDPPREQLGAATKILETLEAFALTWDGSIVYQSQRTSIYAQALEQLILQKRAYPCSCSRKDLAATSVYPGYCRLAPCQPERQLAWRFALDLQASVNWQDAIQGQQNWPLAPCGDPIIRRKDQLWAYQLAVVVDDLAQGVSHVVRGMDLLDSTPWQLQLHQALTAESANEYKPLNFAHLPIIIDQGGKKLSKQNHAPPLDHKLAVPLLLQALRVLQQPVESSWYEATPEQLLKLALSSWQLAAIPSVKTLFAANYL